MFNSSFGFMGIALKLYAFKLIWIKVRNVISGAGIEFEKKINLKISTATCDD